MINAARRKPRKIMRVSAAAELLQESRSTVKNRIARGELRPANNPPPGSTTPVMLYEAQVVEIAKTKGIF